MVGVWISKLEGVFVLFFFFFFLLFFSFRTGKVVVGVVSIKPCHEKVSGISHIEVSYNQSHCLNVLGQILVVIMDDM